MRYLFLLFLIIPTPCFAKTIDPTYIQVSLKNAATKVGVPHKLLWAICGAESNYRANAYNHEDGGIGNHAMGICQVLYTTALEVGMKADENCKRDFRRAADTFLERSYETCRLFGPYTNAFFAAKYLKKKLKVYNGSWISAIAAYNTGSLKICKTGKVYNSRGELLYTCEKGGLLNQRYVDRVLKRLGEIE